MTVIHADIDAEQAVLGALLLYSDPRHTLAAASRGLTAGAFYWPRNKAVFTAALSLAERQASIDSLTVIGELDRLGLAGEVERPQVELLPSCVPAAGNWTAYVDRVVELAQWREWAKAAAEAQIAIERRDRHAFAQAQAQFAARSVGTRHDTYSAERWAATLFDHFSAPAEVIARHAIPLPWGRLTDAMGGGPRPGEYVAWIAATGHGKSTAVDQCIDEAVKHGKRCHIYMTEMTALSRGMRYLARQTGVSYMRQRRNDLTTEERKLILEELGKLSFGCSVAADWDVDDIVRDALRARYDLVVVDLLHGFHYEDERGLDRLSKAMQRLARTSTTIDGHPGTVVFAVTHLKEEGLVRGKVPRPTITSIKGGSSIKQDADAVICIWQDQDDAGAPTGDGEIWLAKGRSMELARIKVRLNPRRFRFDLRADDDVTGASLPLPATEAMPF
jgi:replicative DNA helicase